MHDSFVPTLIGLRGGYSIMFSQKRYDPLPSCRSTESFLYHEYFLLCMLAHERLPGHPSPSALPPSPQNPYNPNPPNPLLFLHLSHRSSNHNYSGSTSTNSLVLISAFIPSLSSFEVFFLGKWFTSCYGL